MELIKTKLQQSIDRVKEAYLIAQKRKQSKLYVGFSGGKDSTVLKRVCELAEVPFELHYNVTGIDPKESVLFCKKNNCTFDRAEKTIWELIIQKGIPPTRQIRYCCDLLKETGGKNQVILTGVRWAESTKRAKRKIYETVHRNPQKRILMNDNEDRSFFEVCSLKGKIIINPIIDWTNADVWNFIKKQNLEYCSLYNEGFKRIGCIGCPMAPLYIRLQEFERYPAIKQKFIQTFQKMLDNMQDKTNVTWKNGQDVFNWWLYGEQKKAQKNQIEFDI